jgi:hypothetical protein
MLNPQYTPQVNVLRTGNLAEHCSSKQLPFPFEQQVRENNGHEERMITADGVECKKKKKKRKILRWTLNLKRSIPLPRTSKTRSYFTRSDKERFN